jgi:hypothetical protein
LNGVDWVPFALEPSGLVNPLPQSPQPQPHTTSQDQQGAAQGGRPSVGCKDGWTDGADFGKAFKLFHEGKVGAICKYMDADSPEARAHFTKEQGRFTAAMNARFDLKFDDYSARAPWEAAGSPAPRNVEGAAATNASKEPLNPKPQIRNPRSQTPNSTRTN